MQKGDSIAWIALYTFGPARWTTYFSGALLPLGAIIFANYRAYNETPLDWTVWAFRVLVLLCSVWCSGITARIIDQLGGSDGGQNDKSNKAKGADRGGPEGRQVQTAGSTSAPQSEI